MDAEKKEIYSSEWQPRKDKIALSVVVSMFFAFNLMFFSPIDFYFTNWALLRIPMKCILAAFAPAAMVLFVLVFTVCVVTRKKWHIIAISLIFGAGLAMYVQGSFLSVDLGELDGTMYKPGVIKIIANIIIWAGIIAVPFLIYKFNRAVYSSLLAYISVFIVLMQAITLIVMFVAAFTGENANYFSPLVYSDETYYISDFDEFTYSSSKNYIIILTDAYDSSCFDYAVEAEPDCISGFDGFTYYRNTLGMYRQTIYAVAYILTGKNMDSAAAYDNDLLFSTLKNSYKTDIYGSIGLITDDDIYANYADNYIKHEITYKNYMYTFITLGKATMYRCVPEAMKNVFWLYDDELNDVYSFGGTAVYSSDDLDFYNRLEKELDITDENCFKLIYLNGLHEPRNITSDLQRAEDWSVSGDEQAIALNKILSAYFDVLKENGVYDNSEIVLLADHGLSEKDDDKKHPLLMIKRAGDTGEGITISDAPISHSDLYPTLLYLAGYDIEEDTVFDIKEDEERERYFAGTDEYITGDIK